MSGSKVEAPEIGLLSAWSELRAPLAPWVRSVAVAFEASSLRIRDAAEVVSATQAELEAVLRLNVLDDETLELVSLANPPMTTWMLLSEVQADDIRRALSGLTERTHVSAFESVRAVIHDLVGASPVEKVSVLGHELLAQAVKKADQYAVWSGHTGTKNLRALRGFATRRRSGKTLTPRQAIYALGMLRDVIAAGAIVVPSPDGDDALCRAILDAVS